MAFFSILKNSLVYYLVGFIVISILAILLLSTGGGDVPVVDFNDVVDTNDNPDSDLESSDPPLRIAVEAMISPEYTKKYYYDLVKLIGSRVGMNVVLIQKKTYYEVNNLLENRGVDIVFVSSGAYVNGHEKFGMEILAVPVSNGKKIYHSYIIVHKDSPHQSFDDLKGKRFAYTQPTSNSGCLAPKHMLIKSGKDPKIYFSETIYTYSHDDSIKAVATGLVDTSAVDSLIWKFMNTNKNKYSLQTRIIEKSPPYGIPPVVVHPGMEKDLKSSLKSLFINLHKNEDAKKYLKTLQIDRFVEGSDEMYTSIREMKEEQKGI